MTRVCCAHQMSTWRGVWAPLGPTNSQVNGGLWCSGSLWKWSSKCIGGWYSRAISGTSSCRECVCLSSAFPSGPKVGVSQNTARGQLGCPDKNSWGDSSCSVLLLHILAAVPWFGRASQERPCCLLLVQSCDDFAKCLINNEMISVSFEMTQNKATGHQAWCKGACHLSMPARAHASMALSHALISFSALGPPVYICSHACRSVLWTLRYHQFLMMAPSAENGPMLPYPEILLATPWCLQEDLLLGCGKRQVNGIC